MDRKLCVLVYSTYSLASKRLVEYVGSLPFDFASVTGMTLLCADSAEVRRRLAAENVTTVPSLIVQYFNGTTRLYEDRDVYAFIESVVRSVGSSNGEAETTKDDEEIEAGEPTEPPRVEKKDVLSAAMAMQKSREDESEPRKTKLVQIGNR